MKKKNLKSHSRPLSRRSIRGRLRGRWLKQGVISASSGRIKIFRNSMKIMAVDEARCSRENVQNSKWTSHRSCAGLSCWPESLLLRKCSNPPKKMFKCCRENVQSPKNQDDISSLVPWTSPGAAGARKLGGALTGGQQLTLEPANLTAAGRRHPLLA